MGGRRAGRPGDRRCVGRPPVASRREHQQSRQRLGWRRVLGRRRPGASNRESTAAAHGPGLCLRISGSSSSAAPPRAARTTARDDSDHRDRQPLGSRDGGSVAERADRPVAARRLGSGPVAAELLGQLAVGDVRAQRDHQPGPDHWDELGTGMSPTWRQCSAPAVSDTSTRPATGRGDAAVHRRLRRGGRDGQRHQDDLRRQQHPTLSLSGPTDAPSTAGTQYVTASAGGSPSGIDGIACSVDGSPCALVSERERAGAGERLGRALGQLQRLQQRRG